MPQGSTTDRTRAESPEPGTGVLTYRAERRGAPAGEEGVDGLRARGLTKRFGDVVALNGLDLTVPKGQLIGFLGPNGAGKTTAMRAILGLVALDEGTISWQESPITAEDRRHIGYMPQERGLYPGMRVGEHIAYIGRLAGLDGATAARRAHDWASRVGLADREHDQIQELSTGNQQRVQLAVALVHEPTLLVLDEPFAGLDPVAVSILSEVMHDRVDNGVTVVFSSHQLALVEDLADQLTIVADGSARATGSVSELRRRSPHRFLRIEWEGEAPRWAPPNSVEVDAPAGVSHFRVPADTEAGALLASASAVGTMAAVSFEPPRLEDVFRELVAS